MTAKRKPPRLQAEAAYENAHLVARDLLARIEEQLQDEPVPGGETKIDWGHVGSIGHVNELLSEIVTFLGGTND
ncbi:MAG: hypothetical protein WD851_10100 [Pirellulales bacterium]